MNRRLEISDYLNKVHHDWQSSRGRFPKNVYLTDYWPIPFFGNPRTAVVATVGVNPSSGEFRCGRSWSAVRTLTDWKKRLKDYFTHTTPPHGWFESWRVGLAELGLSYEGGTAAHFDVSYRPTKAMLKNRTTNPKEFRQMVEHDVIWFFRLLPLCERLKVLLVFGPIIRADGSKETLMQFLKNHVPRHGFTMLQDGELQHTATGRTFFIHEADTRGENCITCRVVKSIQAHRGALRQQLDG